MTTSPQVPPLRFKGFDGAWEKKRLGEIPGSWFKGQALSKDEIDQDGSNKCIHYGELFTRYGAVIDSVCSSTNVAITVRSQVGDLLFPASDVTPDGLGRCAALLDKDVLLGGDIIGFRQGYADSELLSYAVNNERAQIIRLVTGTTVRHSSAEKLKEVKVQIPSDMSEQRKIGAVFRSLDGLIEGRERSLEKLQAMKKAMLEKMFPQGDDKVPEVRFKGFDGAWERKRLGDLVSKRSQVGLSRGCPFVEYEDVVSFEGVLTHDVAHRRIEKRGIVFKGGDVLFGKLRPYLGNWFRPEFDGVAVGDWWVLKPQDIDSGFLYVLIQSSGFQSLANQSAGSKMPRADWTLVSEAFYQIPTISEQRKIGAYFRSLDALISARREEVEKLRQMKKALLDRMFA